jgi:Fe-S-cluster containining protein
MPQEIEYKEICMVKPSKVRKRAEKLDEENFYFRIFLREHAHDEKLDSQFLKLSIELFREYDCSKCNNCCKEYEIPVKGSETEVIATFLGISNKEFVSDYLMENQDYDEGEDEGEFLFKTNPCSFLGENGQCQIEACQPSACKEFPFTDKPDRMSSLYSTLSIAHVCPVVFEILERLKGIYRYNRRWRG